MATTQWVKDYANWRSLHVGHKVEWDPTLKGIVCRVCTLPDGGYDN